ncbi:MAG TPA: aminodeoxychorismate synthase component I [Solirubrobacteraceae bacterium]|nr:aminodeoxychorismate synthase component I [Solirubrobacteraceae bacterium]
MAVVALSTTPVRLERTRLDCRLAAPDVLRALAAEPWPFALTGEWAGGGAVVGSRPLIEPDESADPFALLDALPPVDDAGVPAGAVGGGWFGWLGYRLGRRIEVLPEGPPRPVPLPDFQLAYYDNVLRRDVAGNWWFEALVSEARRSALSARLAQLRDRLGQPAAAPAWSAPEPFELSPEAQEAHMAAVQQCRERIAAGEIFQANICLRLESRFDGALIELFARAASALNPGYAAAFAAPWGGIASLSPELFLRHRGPYVVTAPIKGTVRRTGDRRGDRAAVAGLRESAKDAAEHVMIVDLMRNDLGRVCEYGSVQAPRWPYAEELPGLWHLVSRVTGRMRRNARRGDLLRATFPPGSVTGAPKVQAMKVISALESSGREAYTGAVGFSSPCAGLELNVAIRTLELCGGRLWLGVGGGIVADSDPARELDEVVVKASPILGALGCELRLGAPVAV